MARKQATAVVYEAVQERPVYWDGAAIHKQPLSARGGDWRAAHHRVARAHSTLEAAESYARRILAQRPGVPVEIYRTGRDGGRVAIVSRDALGRDWCDVVVMEALL